MASTKEGYKTDCFAWIWQKATPIYTGSSVTQKRPSDPDPVDKSPKTVDKSVVLGKTRLFVRFSPFSPPLYMGVARLLSPHGYRPCGIKKLILLFGLHPQESMWRIWEAACRRYRLIKCSPPKDEEHLHSHKGSPHIHKPYEDYYRYLNKQTKITYYK